MLTLLALAAETGGPASPFEVNFGLSSDGFGRRAADPAEPDSRTDHGETHADAGAEQRVGVLGRLRGGGGRFLQEQQCER